MANATKKRSEGVEQVEVSLREISALHDVTALTRLVAGRDGPELLVELPGIIPGRVDLVDARGDDRPPVPAAPAVRWWIEQRGGGSCWRTFDRTASRRLDAKYVYVFRGTEPDGRDARLHRFQHFAAGKLADGDVKRALAGEPEDLAKRKHAGEKLLLDAEVVSKAGRRPAIHFFHLAPYPLSPDRIDALAHALTWRAVRLYDPAYTDWYDGDPEKNVSPLVRRPPEHGKTGYLVHLPDVLAEAERRHSAYVAALEALAAERAERARNRHYALAKRIEVVTLRTPALHGAVASVWPYVTHEDRRGSRLYLQAHLAAASLTSWLGTERRGPGWIPNGRDALRVGVHHAAPEGNGLRVLGPHRVEEAGPWGSPFSEKLRDHAESEPSIRDAMLGLAAYVQGRLSEVSTGERWLEANLDRALGSGDALADAGADLIFQTKRKSVATVPEALGFFLDTYGKAWTRRYREDALKELGTWVTAVYGIDLRRIEPRAARRAFTSSAKRQLRRARKRGIAALELNPGGVDAVKLTKRAASILTLGVEAVNVSYAIEQALSDPGDRWKWIDATGSALDAYTALAEAGARVPRFELPLYRIGRVAVTLSPVAFVAGAIDIATGIRDVQRSQLIGESVGNGIKTTGAVLALGTALVAEVPPLMLLAALGVGLQALGNYVTAHFSPLPTFLRNSEFGESSWLDAAASVVGPEKTEWCKVPLTALRQDVEAQHRALDELLHDFTPRLEVQFGHLRLKVEMANPGQLSECSFFDADVEYRVDGSAPRKESLRAGQGFDDEPLLGGEWVVLPPELDPPAIRRLDDPGPSGVRVSGWVELDVYGDGKLRVRRSIEFERLELR